MQRFKTATLTTVLAVMLNTSMVHAENLDPANIFLITHSEVQIDSDSSSIWPFILDTSEWKTLADASHHAGSPDSVGEIEMIRGESNGTPYQFYLETIELIAEKRKVVAIYFDEAAQGDIAFAAWTLFSNPEGTLVTYDVYSVNRIPGVATEQVASVREQMTAPNRTRFQDELVLLKQLVEE